MNTSLLALIEAIAASDNTADLRARLLPLATPFFVATRGAVFLLAEMPEALRNTRNPVIDALIERHAPLHEEQLLKPHEWTALCSRADHGHVLVGPLVQDGQLIGALAFTRTQNETAFDTQNVADLSALCLHASTRMANWPPQKPDFGLAPREQEIAELVAQGKTNAQIGRELFVSSETVKAALKAVFRKTGVTSRAGLVAVLSKMPPKLIK